MEFYFGSIYSLFLHSLLPTTPKNGKKNNSSFLHSLMQPQVSTIMRRVKRQKLASTIQSTTKGLNEEASSCILRPLLDQAIFSPHSSVQVLSSRIENVQLLLIKVASSNELQIDEESLERLHGMLLLQIGFIAASTNDGHEIVDNARHNLMHNLMLTLLQCLRELYLISSSQGKVTIPLDQEDWMESFNLALKLIHDQSNRKNCQERCSNMLNCNPDATDHLQTISVECWKILIILVNNTHLNELMESDQCLLRRFLLLLLDYVGDSHIDKEKKEILRTCLSEMQKPKFGPITNHLASLAAEATKRQVWANGSSEIPSHVTHPRDKIFFWKCICHFADNVTNFICLNNATYLIQEIVEWIDKENPMAFDATECLCLLARKSRATADDGSLVVLTHALTTTILNGDMNTRLTLLPGLYCLLCQRQSLSPSLVSSMERLDEFLDVLAETTLHLADRDSRRLASEILSVITCSLTSTSYFDKEEHLQRTVTRLETLMTSSNFGHFVDHALNTVEHFLCGDSTLRRRVVDLHPTIFTALAQVAYDTFTTHEARHKIMKLFLGAVQQPDTINLVNFARQPRILEAIVHAASIQSASKPETQTLALAILMRLSSKVCNRRVLAKQPGFLSALIRYARRAPHQMENDGQLGTLSRQEMKRQILLLASAL